MSNDGEHPSDCASSYDRVADEYVRRIFDELRGKPLDRELLDRFAAAVRDVGPVCEVGCGPGHVARYLHDRGVSMCGVDLSCEMVDRARQLTPAVEFRQGDMRSLDASDATWAGVVAFYSLIHIPRDAMTATLSELHRVLQPGGTLFIAFHVGDQTLHLDEWWDQPVCVDFHFYRSDEMAAWLGAAEFESLEIIERDPYPEIEHQSRRSYILAHKGEASGHAAKIGPHHG
jgi:SAM-dependent methyltransferase